MSTTSGVTRSGPAHSISPWSAIVVAGAVLVIVGSFLPWEKASTAVGSFTVNGIHTDGHSTLILSVVGLVCGVLALYADRIFWVFPAGVVLFVAAVFSGLDIASLPHPSATFVSLGKGVGIWLCLIGAVVGFLASIVAVQAYVSTPEMAAA